MKRESHASESLAPARGATTFPDSTRNTDVVAPLAGARYTRRVWIPAEQGINGKLYRQGLGRRCHRLNVCHISANHLMEIIAQLCSKRRAIPKFFLRPGSHCAILASQRELSLACIGMI